MSLCSLDIRHVGIISEDEDRDFRSNGQTYKVYEVYNMSEEASLSLEAQAIGSMLLARVETRGVYPKPYK